MEKDINRKNIVKKPKAQKNYVNGPDFYRCLLKFNEKIKENEDRGLPKPQIPGYIGECIMLIAENLSKKFNFVNYTYVEDMRLDAIEKMIEAVEKYDVYYSSSSSPNPLGYFSQIAWNMFLQRIAKEQREQYIKHKNFEKLNFVELTDMNNIDSYFKSEGVSFNNDDHNKVINDFEAKKKKDKPENNYAKHSNLDYSKNRKKKDAKVSN